MKITHLLTTCDFAATCIATSASADTQTIDFSSLSDGAFTSATFGAYTFTHPTYGQDTMVFTSDTGVKAIGDDISSFSFGTGFLLSRTDGAVFDVDAITFALLSGGFGNDVRVTVDPYGPYRQVIGIDADGQSYGGPALTGLTSLFFDAYTDGNAVGISRVTVTSNAAVAAVPEPATWAMMIGGFGLVGGAMRRRNQTRTTVSFA